MILNIDELLKQEGTNRQKLIGINPGYEKDFEKLDQLYREYNAIPNPTEQVDEAYDNMTVKYLEKLKSENPELFYAKRKKKEKQMESAKMNPADKKLSDEFYNLVAQGDQDGIDDMFSEIGPDKSKALISANNYKSIVDATSKRNQLVSIYLLQQADRLGILFETVAARNGSIVNAIISMRDLSLIKKAVEGLKAYPEESKKILKKNMVLEQAIETENDAIVENIESLYADLGMLKDKKGTEKLKEQTGIQSVIKQIKDGTLDLDIPLVSGMERRMAIRMISTQPEIAGGTSYQYVALTKYAHIFDDKLISQDDEFTIFEASSTDFERQFGTSVYELGFAWFNMLNLLSIDDVIAIMFVANISTDLMNDRDNSVLRSEYKDKLKVIIQNPDTNKISGRYYQLNESNMKNLQRAGFLDKDFCPTKMLYCAIVLHAFPFPAFTHPFEKVNISSFDTLFQFNIIKGEYANQVFYSDGDLLYHNFNTSVSSTIRNVKVDVARTSVLNIQSNGDRSDFTKTRAIISHFMPVFYSVPRTGEAIPKFSIRMLDVENRKINWGVYEFSDNSGEIVYVNSYGIGNLLSQVKNNNPELFIYKGALSDEIFKNPADGVIAQYKDKFVVARGINRISLLSENFGANYETYYQEMFNNNHLIDFVLDKLEPTFVKAIYTNGKMRVSQVNPNLLFKVLPKFETPYVASRTLKQPQVIQHVTPVAKRDDRIYLSFKDSRAEIDSKYWPIFDKVQSLIGVSRDEAILDEMYSLGIDTIRPRQLLYLGFDLAQWAVTDKRVNFMNKYKLSIPNIGYVYYLEKI